MDAAHLWLIPALPLLAAAIGAFAPGTCRRLVAGASIAAMAGAFLLACLALSSALTTPAVHQVSNFDWLRLRPEVIRLGWLLDPLTGFMSVMVTLVGALIFVFSLGYMKDDENFARFFCCLSFFAAAMLGVVIANSLVQIFLCWELVGLASYLLIGFWFQKPAAAAAAKKAFLTTRIGDLAFLLGLLWLYDRGHTQLLYGSGPTLPSLGNARLLPVLESGSGLLDSPHWLHLLAQAPIGTGGLALASAASLLIFCGAIGKSGQFPLHTWLPDAMEGPTPVSALIHAATMVAAGVFLVARLFPLFTADQGTVTSVHALSVVASVGAITALLGAVIAVAQTDLKRILAYSTISQLGYMMLALGVGSPGAAIFHLLTHAFFKALLFLGAGSVIHAAHHEQDIRHLGGLRGPMKITFATFAIGTMALSGVPFFFSGFWSKEAILHAVHDWDVSCLPLTAALLGVLLTAFYMTRLVATVFFGGPRSAAARAARENAGVMTVPLIVLAIFSVLPGFIGTPAWPWLQRQLDPGALLAGEGWFGDGAVMLGSIVLVGAGLGLGWWLYGRRPRVSSSERDPLQSAAPTLFAWLAAGMGIDEFYDRTFVRSARALAVVADRLDRGWWGALVAGVALLGKFSGVASRENDEQALNGGFNRAGEGLRAAGLGYARAQTGRTHGYLRVLALGFVVLVLLLAWGGSR